MQGHFKVDLRPHQRRVVVGFPLALREVVCLATHPRPELTIVAGDGGECPRKEKLLELEVRVVACLLVQLAIEGAHHWVEQAPLRLLARLQHRVTFLELLVGEMLRWVVANLLLVVLTPIRVLPVAAHGDVTHEFLQPVDDLQAHAIVHDLEGVAQEDEGAVGVAGVLRGRDRLVGQDRVQLRLQILLQDFEGVGLAWRKLEIFLLHELLEGLRRGEAWPQGRGVLRAVFFPMAGVEVVPALDRPEEVEELTHELEVVAGQRILAGERQLDARPHEIA
mmetsp:Transcript_22472/g.45202  ORF Transcript_22472/g.45202 Transcript_22472/m.45202 type:complete len:278 (+) Transcript_22472:183-1016(+)